MTHIKIVRRLQKAFEPGPACAGILTKRLSHYKRKNVFTLFVFIGPTGRHSNPPPCMLSSSTPGGLCAGIP